jgi:hypothetical protein
MQTVDVEDTLSERVDADERPPIVPPRMPNMGDSVRQTGRRLSSARLQPAKLNDVGSGDLSLVGVEPAQRAHPARTPNARLVTEPPSAPFRVAVQVGQSGLYEVGEQPNRLYAIAAIACVAAL